MTPEEFLKKQNIANVIVNGYDLPEYRKTISDLLLEYTEALRQPPVMVRSEQLKCDCGNTENVKLIPICPCCYNPHSGEW